MGIARNVPFRPVPKTMLKFFDRHAPADRQRLVAHGFCVRIRADRRARALPAHARPRSLLPDGLGRQRSRHRAARAELLRRALRSASRRTIPTFAPPAKPPKDPIAISRPNFLELCARLVAQDEQAFEELWRAARALGRLDAHVHDDRNVGAAHESARVPAQPRARRGVPGRRADVVGRRHAHRGRAGRARRPRDAGRVSRAAIPPARRRRRSV